MSTVPREGTATPAVSLSDFGHGAARASAACTHAPTPCVSNIRSASFQTACAYKTCITLYTHAHMDERKARCLVGLARGDDEVPGRILLENQPPISEHICEFVLVSEAIGYP